MTAPEEVGTGTWACEAYGPDGPPTAVCFFPDGHGERTCASLAVCQERMGEERQRVFRRINELAADGDEDMAFLADAFPTPDGLLDGDRDG